MKSNIIDLHNAFLKQDFSYVNDAHKKETENQYRQNITVKTLNDISNLDGDKSSLLYGVPYTLKDLYSTKGIRTTGGSKILEQYLPPFNSQVYELLTKNGGILISKSNLDEFGMGGSGLYGPYGDIINPYDSNYIVGGSSGGSAVQVATNIVPFSVVTDTADSARSPASYLGIVGFKPSYGAISRYGVIPYAPSLDTVGILANYVADISIVNHILAAHDERDFTSQKNITTCELPKTIDNIKISVIKGIEEFLPQQIKDIYLDNINSLSKKYEITYVDFSLELIETISPIYMIISYAEAASTFSNYTGITFGKTIQEKNFQNSAKAFRSANFSNMVKRKLIIGNKFLNDWNQEPTFVKAKKIRGVIVEEFKKILDATDCLIIPSHSMFSPSIEDFKGGKLSGIGQWYAADLLNLANFAGTPSLTLPTYKDGVKNFGININCKQFDDQKLIDISYTLENYFTK